MVSPCALFFPTGRCLCYVPLLFLLKPGISERQEAGELFCVLCWTLSVTDSDVSTGQSFVPKIGK